MAQEAYVRLLQLHQPGAVSFLRGYLFKIAANLSVDVVRRRDAWTVTGGPISTRVGSARNATAATARTRGGA